MTPKNPKNGKKWQKGIAPPKIYPPGVPNQEYAPLELKNEMLVTVGILGYVPSSNVHCGTPKNLKFGKMAWFPI